MMIQRVSSQRYYQTMGNDTGRMPAAANDGSVGSTAGGSPDAAAPYATPSFAHGIVPFDHEISSNQHLTFSYAEQSFASANIPWDPDHDALHLKERGMFTNTALIISDQCPFTIKCATFDGDVKAPISERIELSGSMIRQLNDAMTFLNGHNRRDDGRQCPPDALREALVNAVLHRDYAFPGPTLVNIFPSRVEIVSLGGLMDGIEINDLLNGISQPRNPWLAELFTRLGFSENYGTGIRRIMEEYDEASDNPQIRVGTSSVVMVLPLPSQPSPGGSRTRGDATKGGSAQGADGHDAAQGHAKMYAFPTIMTTATSDPTVALAGTRVIGCVPVRLSDGSALRTSPLIAPGRITSPAATAQLPPNAGQTLEEVTLHCIAQAGVPLSRQQIADNLGATKNQMTYVLHHLVEQGRVLKRGRSRATRYSMP